MRASLSILVALVAGLVIGQLSVKPDLRRARAEIQALQEQLQARGRRDNNLRNVTAMLRMPEPTPVESPRPPATNGPAVERAAPAPASFSNELHTAAELWRTRSEVARGTLLDRLAASPVQAQLFDQAITNLNAQLAGKIQSWAEYLRQQPEVTPETGLRMMNDLSATVLATYDELDQVFPGDWRATAGRQFQLFDFINPAIALPLAEIEGAFGGRRPRRQP
jgi:hypothetical protein